MAIFNQPFLSGGFPSMNRVTGPVGGWVELGRTTLGAAADTITVSSLADKRYYMLLFNKIPDTNATVTWQVNNDTGNNYSVRQSQDGGTDTTFTSQDDTEGGDPVNSTPSFTVAYVANRSANEKLATQHVVSQNTAGAGTAVARMETVWKWANTSNAINRFDQKNLAAGAGDYDVGSEVVVLGWDESDTHTNNFWEELHSDSQTGQTVDNIDSGTFTNKKYLWVQCWFKGTGNTTVKMTFNNSTDSTYAWRYSNNGGADSTGTSQASVTLHNTKANATKFLNMFIVNDGSNEILGIAHMVEDGGSGAASDPDRRETVFKRSTATAITDIEFDNDDTGDFTDWEFKIWGAD